MAVKTIKESSYIFISFIEKEYDFKLLKLAYGFRFVSPKEKFSRCLADDLSTLLRMNELTFFRPDLSFSVAS